MTATVPTPSDLGGQSRYDRLIQPARVHGSLYTDPSIYAEELRRIWHTTWVFVGHESEVPQPNDYVRKQLADQDVVMTRDKDGEVHLLINRCAHRGLQVCDDTAATPARSDAPTTAGPTATPASCSATPTTRATAARTSSSSAWARSRGSTPTRASSSAAWPRRAPPR